jgi:hypothetical protein
MYRRPMTTALLFLLVLPVAGWAQDFELPTPEEYAEAAERAENAPLFQTHDILRMTLRTRIEWIRDERSDSVQAEGTLTFIDLDGTEVVRPVKTRARGNFRRDKKTCNFPPLRLNFPKEQMEGTVFDGQDKLKLVTPCNDGRDDYQRYIFDEYLAYRVFNILTPISFRVRLVEITYEDVDGDYDTRTKYAFLIEDEDDMADRRRARFQDVTQFHPSRTFADYSVLTAMFNYMIGNTDWSPVYFHNVKLIRTEEARYLTVPYDFDSSGTVNARYATVDPALQDRARRVTNRLYRGFCRPELAYGTATARFAETRDEVTALYNEFAALGFEQYDADDAERTLKFFEKFYEVVDREDRFESRILRDCRDLETGRQ